MPTALAVNILGVASHFPRGVRSNADFDYAAAGVSPQRLARSGVLERRWADPDETIIDLAEVAADRALHSANVARDQVDRLILVTSTMQPGLVVPTGAVRLQSRLGLLGAQAMTLVETCCGSLIAMELGAGLVRAGMARNVLVVAAETFSKTFNPTSPTTFEIGMSMGDAAGAVVLGPREGWDDGLVASYGCSASSFQSGLGMRPVASGPQAIDARIAFGTGPAPPSWDGVPLARSAIVDALQRFTTTTIPAAIRNVLTRAGLAPADVAFYVLHQPNRMFLEAWKAEAGIPEHRTIDTLARFGNLSSVSVIANLDAAWRSGRLRSGDKVVFASAGEGAVWGAMLWVWRHPAPPDDYSVPHSLLLTSIERHSIVELMERLDPFRPPASPTATEVPCEVLVLKGVAPEAAFVYLAEPSHLERWTLSLRQLEPIGDNVFRAVDNLSPTKSTFVRVHADARTRTVAWELGHQPHRLWLTRRVILTDARDVAEGPGTASMWTVKGAKAPDEAGASWGSVQAASLALELQNLSRIFGPPPKNGRALQDKKGPAMLLEDQIAIVAGGSKGIGGAVARLFAAHGATVAVVAREQKSIDAMVEAIESRGGRAMGVVADCRYKGEVDSMLRSVVSAFGAPHILVNTIGGGQPELVVNTGDELFDRMVALNVKTTFLLSRAIAPYLIERERGKIIHTASIGAKTPMAGLAVYDGCKAFVVAFTRDLALELGRFGVNVNCVCPGHIPTEATRSVGEKLCEITGMGPQQLQESMARRMAIPRFPSADDIAKLYLFLASTDSDFMTGQALNFSSGLEMR